MNGHGLLPDVVQHDHDGLPAVGTVRCSFVGAAPAAAVLLAKRLSWDYVRGFRPHSVHGLNQAGDGEVCAAHVQRQPGRGSDPAAREKKKKISDVHLRGAAVAFGHGLSPVSIVRFHFGGGPLGWPWGVAPMVKFSKVSFVVCSSQN